MSEAHRLCLREHLPAECTLLNATARALAAAREIDLDVMPSGHDRWTITPGSRVGSAVVSDVRVSIRPKIGIRNVLHLMGLTLPERIWKRDVLGFEQEPELLEAMVQVFRRGLDHALAGGLRHNYEARSELVSAVRGRIDMTQLVRRPAVLSTIPCRFEEHTANFELNQVLLAATRRALGVPGVPIPDQRRLRKHLEVLEDAAVDETVPPLDQVDRWEPTYLDRHYEAAVRTGAMLLRGSSISDQPGESRSVSFVVDMNKLVEQFITMGLRRRMDADLTLRSQHPTTLGVDGRVNIRPDLVVLSNRRPVFVADIKYKDVSDVEEVSTSDLYQLAAYARVLGVKSGALITVGMKEDRRLSEPLLMRPDGPLLHVWTVDLTGTRDGIEREIDVLASRLAAIAQLDAMSI